MANFTKVNPGDPIQAVQLNQVIDALIGTSAGTAVPIAVTAVNDATNYAVTIQNDETGNSRALNVLKSDGTTLIKADASGVTLGSPLNLPTNSITSAAIQDAGVHNVDLASDTARLNLLTNGGFEIWQRGNGPFTGAVRGPDRWYLNPGGTSTISVSRDSANKDGSGSYCAAVTYTHNVESNLTQDFGAELAMLAGKTVSFSARVKTSTANAVRLRIYDGAVHYSNYHSGGGTYETLTLTWTFGASPTSMWFDFDFNASCTAYIDNAMLVVGSQAADYAPMHPADDLARCLRYYEKLFSDSGGDGWIRGYQGANGMIYQNLPLRAIKPVAPTCTKVGAAWTIANATGQPTFSASPNVVVAQLQATAAGEFWANNGAAGINVVIEANP